MGKFDIVFDTKLTANIGMAIKECILAQLTPTAHTAR